MKTSLITPVQFTNLPTEEHKKFLESYNRKRKEVRKWYLLLFYVITVCISISYIGAMYNALIYLPSINNNNICFTSCILILFILAMILSVGHFVVEKIKDIAHTTAEQHVKTLFPDMVTVNPSDLERCLDRNDEIQKYIKLLESDISYMENVLNIHTKKKYDDRADVAIDMTYEDAENQMVKTNRIILYGIDMEWSTTQKYCVYDVLNNKLTIPKSVM